MNAWIVILVAGLGSYLLRLSMVTVAGGLRLPARVDEASSLVAPAAFAALAATSLVEATVGGGPAAAPLAAVAVAVLAVARTGSSYAAMFAGMPTLWLLTAVLPG